MKTILKPVFLFILLAASIISVAQSTHRPDLNFTVGSFVSAAPDSIFKLQADAFVGDSIEVASIRLVELDSSFILFDHEYVLSSLPVEQTVGAWKENYTIHIDVPDYNPFRRKHYLFELLGASGQLLFQLEKEF